MSTMLEQMKKRMEERKPSFEKDLSVFPFWNLKLGATSTVRLLPYNDPYTEAFWAEKMMVPMAFTDPADDTKVLRFMAPCREMYDRSERCPILRPVRDLYNEAKDLKNAGHSKECERLERIASAHWKKYTFYYQGFVIKPGFTEEETPENPIRVFPFQKKLHGVVYESIFENEADPFEKLPTGEFTLEDVAAVVEGEADEDILAKFEGHNFVIKKGKQGDYNDWVTGSGWASNSKVSLTDEQIAALHQYGYHDLTKRLPDRPSDEQYEVLVEMVQVSIGRLLTGENGYWNKEWEEVGFKPFRRKGENDGGDGGNASDGAESSSKPKTTGAAKSTESALEKLRKNRGKKAEPETDASDDSSQEGEAEEGSAKTKNEEVAARIRAKLEQQRKSA